MNTMSYQKVYGNITIVSITVLTILSLMFGIIRASVNTISLTVLYDSVDKSQRNQIKENANQIYNRFLGTNCENFEIEEEYLIH